jgi:SLT domain-containing protein
MSLDLTKQRLYSIETRVNNYIDQNIIQWGTEEILLPGQTDIANSISQRASEALSLEKTGYMKIDLVWDFRSEEGAPIHFFLEYGTRPHEIRAKGREHGGADALHWTGPSGESRFAKVVQHPGTQARELISQIKEERLPDLRRRIIDETQTYMELEAI